MIKKQLITALKANRHVVAMMGDGINDLPALRESNCGITMACGAAAARNVSELVLTENNFAVLPEIVAEGRRVMNNITRSAGVFFIKTLYSILLAFFCIVSNVPFPFIPIQITLIDIAIEAYPSFFLSFEPNKEHIRDRFLSLALHTAFPYAILIAFFTMMTKLIAPYTGVSTAEIHTALYLLVGFISVLALFCSSRPLNPLRSFLCATAGIGFFAAAGLFGDILSLSPPTASVGIIFGIEALISLISVTPLSKLSNHLLKK
jgi:cation-transporting ATPase E